MIFIAENDPVLDSPERFARLLFAFALKVADERSARWPKKFAKQWTALIGPDVPVRAEDGKLMGFDHLRAWIKPKESEPVPTTEISSST